MIVTFNHHGLAEFREVNVYPETWRVVLAMAKEFQLKYLTFSHCWIDGSIRINEDMDRLGAHAFVENSIVGGNAP